MGTMDRYSMIVEITSGSLLNMLAIGREDKTSIMNIIAPQSIANLLLNIIPFSTRLYFFAPMFCPTKGPKTDDNARITAKAKNSIREATPNPATALGPYPAIILVITPMDKGVIILAPAIGTPMNKIDFHDWRILLNFGNTKDIILSRIARTHKATEKVINLAITVEIAAPAIPSFGKGPIPNIKRGSIMKLTVTATIIIALGVFVSPVALIALFPTIGTTTKGIPAYQMLMYFLIRGRIAGVAQSILNKGSIVRKPMITKHRTTSRARSKPSVVSR